MRTMQFVVTTVEPADEIVIHDGAPPLVVRVQITARSGSEYKAELVWQEALSQANPKVGEKFTLAPRK